VYNEINPIGKLIPNFSLNFFLSLPNLLFSRSVIFSFISSPPFLYAIGYSKILDLMKKYFEFYLICVDRVAVNRNAFVVLPKDTMGNAVSCDEIKVRKLCYF
jgi:hypothetical protein